MSRMAPLDLDEIKDPEIHELLAECEEFGVPDALFVRIFARKPDQLKGMLRAMLASHRDGNIDHKLKEIIRIQLARFAEDPYFSALRSKKAIAAGLTEEMIEIGCEDYEDSDLFSERRRLRCATPSRCSWMRPRSTRFSTTRCTRISPMRRSWSSGPSSHSSTACIW